ncbi:antibiotic biosynthesis monooxygenase family protein [Enterococcus sp. DIV0876]|uniref:antibiotic biosynthesis monooxygenase family protein n=1 Tax=Enterococcus sp. DIV0876 TaxID=2774633 RepID=UPI003D2FED3F
MYIRTVAFEVVPEGKDVFLEKIMKDVTSMKGYSGCLSTEAWLSETKKSVTFQLVSKWQEKKDFQAWLKRPEHLQKHREAHRAEKEGHAKPSIVLSKTSHEFSLIHE